MEDKKNLLENEISQLLVVKDCEISNLKRELDEKNNLISNIYQSKRFVLISKVITITHKLIPYKSIRFKFSKLIYKVFNRIIRRISRKKEIVVKREIDLIESSNVEVLVFNYEKTPKVSIVIPVYNQFEYTYNCLKSILSKTKGLSYEIIIADDVSTDETVNINKYVENIKIVRNEKNKGFLKNCNDASKIAKGEYICFLNNDTEIKNEWLEHLVNTFNYDSKIGMVGSKLVYSDGSLQESGGIIWKDASGWNYGRLDNPEKSEYNYVKEVDYISGASIIISKSLWEEIGGFDERYAPAYFEDSDLAFEVRKRGYKVVYQPKSVVVHFEGISHGKDEKVGIKSCQVDNRPKFIEKWKDVLEKEHSKNGEDVFLSRERTKGKKTILVIDHYVPTFDKDAGSRTTMNYLKIFLKMGFNVKFLGDNFARIEPYTSILQQMGIEVLYGSEYCSGWKNWIKENSKYINYIYLNRPHISEKYIDFVKENTNAKIIYYGHDLHFLREIREYEITKNEETKMSSEKWKKKELEIMSKSDVVYYPSFLEIDEIKKYNSKVIARAITAYSFDIFEEKEIDFCSCTGILFVGGFSHKPNIDAIVWFCKDILPIIKKQLSDVKLFIVGSNPTEEVKKLASKDVFVTGFVTDEQLQFFYKTCRMVVIPLRYGAGVKGKVVEAMYHQVPMITTNIGAEGLAQIEDTLIISDEASDFANKTIELYKDFEMLKKISKKEYMYVKNNFSESNIINIISEDFKI